MATPNDTMLKKTCTTCGRELPATLEYFYSNKQGKYGLRSVCRECHCIRTSAYQKSHREQRRIYEREYVAKHADQLRAYRIAYAEKNREKYKHWLSEHYINHRSEYIARNAAYRASTHGQAVLRAAEARRRQSRVDGGTYSPAEFEEVLKAHTDKNNRLICALCGKPIEGEYHIDHWIPLRHGGSNEAGNLRVMHPKCNLKKHANHPHKLGLLI